MENSALWAVDHLGAPATNGTFNATLARSEPSLLEPYLQWDPVYTLSIIATVLGVIWFCIFTPIIFRLEKRPKHHWLASKSDSDSFRYSVLSNEPDDVRA